VQPGNGTGAPGPATTAPTGSNGGAAVTIIVGSGAETPAPQSSRRSGATPSPATRSMPRPSSAVRRGTGPMSCRPGRSIGQRAGDRARWRLDEGARPAGRVGTG
jgi:hypothetical protein